MECEFKPVDVIRLAHGFKTARHPLGVTMRAARADLVAAGNRIPGRFRPFDRGIGTHIKILSHKARRHREREEEKDILQSLESLPPLFSISVSPCLCGF